MLRPLLIALAAVTMLTFAGTAGAGKPDKTPTPIGDIAFAAGDLCAFPLDWNVPSKFDNAFLTIHDDYVFGGGRNFSVLTNLETHKSIQINSTGPAKILFLADGIDVDGTGHWLIGETAEDPAANAPSLLLYTGHIHFTVDSTNGTRIESYSGTAPIDLCAALS